MTIPSDTRANQRTHSASGSASKFNTPSSTSYSAPHSEPTPDKAILKSFPPEALAQALAEQLTISVKDWHQLSANRSVRAKEQTAAALIYLLKDQPEEALPRLVQAVGWLDKTLKAPPCPTHGKKAKRPVTSQAAKS